jgi:hypothetical protein
MHDNMAELFPEKLAESAHGGLEFIFADEIYPWG